MIDKTIRDEKSKLKGVRYELIKFSREKLFVENRMAIK